MIDKEFYEIIKNLLEISKENYHKFKNEFMNDENTQNIKDIFKVVFETIEKHRPELMEGESI